MGEKRRLERLTASDLFLLLWDDYGWATDIGGLAILCGLGTLHRSCSGRRYCGTGNCAFVRKAEPTEAGASETASVLMRGELAAGALVSLAHAAQAGQFIKSLA